MNIFSPRHSLRALGFLLVAMTWLCPLFAENPGHKQVLVLHSYHLGYVWTSNIHGGLLSILRNANTQVDLRTEYLDWKHYPTQANLDRQYENLKAKYQHQRFDLILATDNKATDFLLEHRQELFPGAPMAFCGYNGFQISLIQNQPGVTGIAENVDGAGTLEIALHLLPDTQRVWVVCDGTETGRAVRQDMERALNQYQGRLQANYLGDGQTTEEVLTQIATAPEQTLILAGPFNQDGSGRFLDLWELADLIRERGLSAPVVHLYEEALGHGVLGGRLMSGWKQGEALGCMAIRILDGVKPEQIPPIQYATVRDVVDYREMEHRGIPASRIPGNCEVLNPPRSYYEQYHRWIMAGLIVSLALTLALSILLFLHRQEERALRHSEARLKALIQHMPLLACAFDPKNAVIVWNHACEVSTGYSAEEIVHASSPHNFTQDEAWRQVLRLARGDARESESVLCHQDKQGQTRIIRWVTESRNYPIQGWAGWVVGIDVTERRLAEAERTRLAQAVSQTVDAVLITSNSGEITYANAAAGQLFSQSPEDLQGQDLWSCLGTRGDSEPFQVLRRETQAGRPWRGRLRKEGASGAPQILEAAFSPIQAQESQSPESVVVLRDITSQLEMEAQVRRSQRMDSLGSLAGGIAHDFGNLMQAIQLESELLEERLTEFPKHLPHIATIRSTALRGGDLVRHLLSFARSKPVTLGPINLHEIIEELRLLLKHTLPKQIRINLALDASRPVIEGDASQILQILMNLALNARDAMPQGGTLTLATENRDSHLEVRVRDTGSGMPPEVMARIFEPFFTTKEPGKGTGMGLAMTYTLVKSHGGQIDVDSVPGQGTTFRLRFPLSASAVPGASAS